MEEQLDQGGVARSFVKADAHDGGMMTGVVKPLVHRRNGFLGGK